MRVYKRICIAIAFFLIFGIVITGCSQQEKKESSTTYGPIKEAVAPYFLQEESLTDTNRVGSNSSAGSADTLSNSEQKQEPSEVHFAFYQSGPDFIKSIINKRGSVEITSNIRERFMRTSRKM